MSCKLDNEDPNIIPIIEDGKNDLEILPLSKKASPNEDEIFINKPKNIMKTDEVVNNEIEKEFEKHKTQKVKRKRRAYKPRKKKIKAEPIPKPEPIKKTPEPIQHVIKKTEKRRYTMDEFMEFSKMFNKMNSFGKPKLIGKVKKEDNKKPYQNKTEEDEYSYQPFTIGGHGTNYWN